MLDRIRHIYIKMGLVAINEAPKPLVQCSVVLTDTQGTTSQPIGMERRNLVS